MNNVRESKIRREIRKVIQEEYDIDQETINNFIENERNYDRPIIVVSKNTYAVVFNEDDHDFYQLTKEEFFEQVNDWIKEQE